MEFEQIKARFNIKQDNGDSCKAVCPCHDDKQASLSISYDNKNFKTLIYCHAGCDTRDILTAIGLKMTDLFDKDKITGGMANGKGKKVAAVYDYVDAEGNLVFQKIRFEPKSFSQRRIIGNATVWGLDGGIFYETYPGSNNWSKKKRENVETRKFEATDPVLYRLPELIKAVKDKEMVFIVEGEKDVDNMHKLGLTATCNFDGASKGNQKPKWRIIYNSYFKGADVVLIPDNDDAGQAHMEYIASSLKGIAKSIKIINLSGLPDKGDITDWLEMGHSKEELIQIINNTEPYDESSKKKSLINFNFSDVGNAERLVYLYGEDIRYNPIRGKWLVWSGKHWEIDNTGKIERLARKVIRKLQLEGSSLAGDDVQELVKKIKSFVLRSEGDSRIKAMINQAKSQIGIPIIENELDRDIFLLNLKNGTLNLKTGKLQPHNRKDYITKFINMEYFPDAQCPNWIKFIDKIFMGDKELIEYVQKSIGYSLTGATTEQCFYMLYGNGANGKSTFLNAIQRILGDYADNLKGSSLMLKRNDDGARGDLAKLHGKRFVTASELNEGQTFDESLIKALTGGDTIPVRFLYGEEFPLTPQFKLWIGTNEKPKVKGANLGIWRRVRLIPFLYTFNEDERDENFFEKYIEPELPGILAWAVQGCLMWQKEGIKTPEKVNAAVNDYKSETDVLQRFIDDCCVVEDGKIVSTTNFYAAFVKWCEEEGERELSSTKLGIRMKEKGFEQKRTAYMRYWDGIGLLSERKDGEFREIKGEVINLFDE